MPTFPSTIKKYFRFSALKTNENTIEWWKRSAANGSKLTMLQTEDTSLTRTGTIADVTAAKKWFNQVVEIPIRAINEKLFERKLNHRAETPGLK
jgi:hypothetical protein